MRVKLSAEENARRKAAIEDALKQGYAPYRAPVIGKGSAVEVARKKLRLPKNALKDWVRQQEKLAAKGEPNHMPDWSLNAQVESPSLSPVEQRREDHDSDFWRSRAKALTKDLAKVEKALEEVAGMSEAPMQPPEWMLLKAHGRRKRAVVSMLFTDLHMGEVVDPDQILGLNKYDPEIALRRAKLFFQAGCEIGPRWATDCMLEGLFLALGGDLISGDIHEELRITNALTSHEQVYETVSSIVAGIKLALKAYKRVHVASVPGNHARTTEKPMAKLYAKLSYDTLIAKMVRDQFKYEPRVTFQIGTSPDAIIPLLGRTIFLTHGDKMGTGGGQGFAGPILPIVRGTKKVEAQQARARRTPDVIMHGHYHHSANPGPVFSNGSFPGYTEYGNGLRASLEPPQQWLMLIHETWGVRERVPVQLETPAVPPMPARMVPDAMAA